MSVFWDKQYYQQGLFISEFHLGTFLTGNVTLLFSTEDSTFADYFRNEIAAKVNHILFKYSLLKGELWMLSP